MSLLGIVPIIQGVGQIIDNLHTSDKERMELELENKRLDVSVVNKVHDTNIAEANHKSWFVAGWRPSIGWVASAGLLYSFIIFPVFLWLNAIWGWTTIPPPALDDTALMNLVIALLGLGGLRTYEKTRGVTK
jgi:cadmium resistance protein CadD (predicted permease)